ncbi:MAG: response regulator [SAR202 cluster bacterium]|nr:response regulator [SAR202 cluster bacterium]
MTKVLVVDDEKDIRDLLLDDLLDSGYQVIEASNGAEALEKVYSERPDIVLLDLMMPIMNGIEALKALKADPDTVNIPVVLLTAVSADEGEQKAIALGANHYVTKPWEPDAIQTVIKVTLREAAEGQSGVDDWAGEKVEASAFISTGDYQLNIKLGGGVPHEGLTFIEGATATGKSVFCQQFTYTALVHGYGVSYFSSQHSATSLVGQMASLGLNSSRFYRSGQLMVTAIPTVDPSADSTQAVLDLASQVKETAVNFRFVVIDVVTSVTSGSQESAIVSLLTKCKEIGNSGNSVVIAAHPAGMSADLLNRFRSLSDSYMGLRVERVGTRLNNVLEVFKVGNAEILTGIRVNFEVEPGVGVRVDPTSRISV